MEKIPDDVLRVQSLGVNFYVLRDRKGLYLIDGGFVGGRGSLKRALESRGWGDEKVLGILVSHGHLDHILNVKNIADESGAWIAAPKLDLLHYLGQAKYQGLAKVTGILESIGRPLMQFRKFSPDRMFEDGDELDVWRGLRAIHLPGHTAGHSGFYCEELKLLFCADLFAGFGKFSHLPPRIFNQDTGRISASFIKADSLELEGILPNHGWGDSPQAHLDSFRRLKAKIV